MKKLQLVAVCVLLLLVLVMVLVACRGGEETPAPPVAPTPTPQAADNQPAQQQEDPPEEPGGIMNPIGTLPIVNEPFTLSVMTTFRSGQDMETNLPALEFEARTGISVEWTQVPEADMTTRLTLALATGDYPEIIMRWGNIGDHAMIYYFAQMGIFRSISPYIDTYAPNLQRLFATHPYVHNDMIMPNGNIYGFPAVDDCFHCQSPYKLWIYTPWLDALGLDMPETTDDLLNVLRAFRDGDPNGDGVPVVPFLGAQQWANHVCTLLSAWITTRPGHRVQQVNGEAFPTMIQPEFRDGLRFLSQLHDEGLLSSESFVIDRAGAQPIANDPDRPMVGVFPANWMAAFISVDVTDQEGRWNGYRMIPPLRGPGGHQETPLVPLQGNHRAVITNMTSDETMPIAVRWLDNFLTYEFALLAVEGIEGITWRRAEPGEIGIHGGPGMWARIHGVEFDPNVNHFGQMVPNWRSHNFRLSEVANRDIIEQETLLYDVTHLQVPYRQALDNVMPILMFDEATSVELVDLRTNINTFVLESIARFTVGDICIENDWDWYVRELQVIGLDRYVEILNQGLAERRARLGS